MSRVAAGLDVLSANGFRQLRGMRVGLVSHQASVSRRILHAIDLLREKRIELTALFAPEHGFWGTAQDQIPIGARKDPTLGIPIYSLYGNRRFPTAQMLED